MNESGAKKTNFFVVGRYFSSDVLFCMGAAKSDGKGER